MIKKGVPYAVHIALIMTDILLEGVGPDRSQGPVDLEVVLDRSAACRRIQLTGHSKGRCLQSGRNQRGLDIIPALIRDKGNHSLWYLGIDSVGDLPASRPPSDNHRQIRDFWTPAGRRIPGKITQQNRHFRVHTRSAISITNIPTSAHQGKTIHPRQGLPKCIGDNSARIAAYAVRNNNNASDDGHIIGNPQAGVVGISRVARISTKAKLGDVYKRRRPVIIRPLGAG